MAVRKGKEEDGSTKNQNLEHLEIKYNPYTYNIEIINSSIKLNDSSKIKLIIKKNRDRALYFWYKDLINSIYEEFNTKSFEIIFNGRTEDYSDIFEEVTYLKNQGWNINCKLIQSKDKKNILSDLSNYITDIMTNGPEELKKSVIEKKAIEEFKYAQKSEAEVSVVATMSSGKSTLLNAILGNEILPSKNEACTATICRVKDVDGMKGFRLKVETLDGKTLSNWQPANLNDIEKFNDEGNSKGLNLFLEGDVPGINSEEMNLILIDTPGPNNSQNMEHKEATYSFIKDTKNNPLVLYVLNATQHGTNDDAMLLREISDIVKNNGKQAEERFIFALNKIDCFDPEKESIETLIENSKKYLKSFGIENPKIFPISAEAAKLVRLKNNGINLSRSQNSNLNSYEFNFLPEDDYPGIDTIKYASIPQVLKDKLYEESKNDRDIALLNYSGIIAIELYIDRYVNKYAKTQKVKDSISTLKKVVDDSYLEINLLTGKTTEDINKMLAQINEIKEILATKGKDKITLVKQNISKIKGDTEKFSKLFVKIEETFDTLAHKFQGNKISQEKANIIIEDTNKDLENLVLSLKTTVTKIINEELKEKSEEIINELKVYFSDILGDIILDTELKDVVEGKFNLELPSSSKLIQEGTYTVNECVGERYSHTESTSKWYNPFSWGSKEDIYVNVYEDKNYVDLTKISEIYLDLEKRNMRIAVQSAQNEMFEKIENLKGQSLENIEIVEKNVDNKMNELKKNIEDQEKLLNQKSQFEKKIKEIANYKNKLDNILKV